MYAYQYCVVVPGFRPGRDAIPFVLPIKAPFALSLSKGRMHEALRQAQGERDIWAIQIESGRNALPH